MPLEAAASGGANPVGTPRTREPGAKAADDERERNQTLLDAERESARTEVDASLRPLARALLALAEQLSREEGP